MSYTGSVLVHWNMSTESDLAGYRVYVGYASRVYDASLTYDTLGVVTCSSGQPGATVSGVANGALTYAAVTAYDSNGNESTFSAEVSMLKTVPLLRLLRQVR